MRTVHLATERTTSLIGLIVSAFLGCATQPPPVPVAPSPVPPPPAVVEETPMPTVPLDEWSERFPAASKALLAWVNRFPHASRRVIAWDEEHPDETKELVIWALSYPEKGFPAFADTHPKWPFVAEFLTRQRPTIEAFLDFCQHHEAAVRALFEHPGGLARVVRLLPSN